MYESNDEPAAQDADVESVGDEAMALAAFDRWLRTIVDDTTIFDRESNLIAHQLFTVRDMAARAADVARQKQVQSGLLRSWQRPAPKPPFR